MTGKTTVAYILSFSGLERCDDTILYKSTFQISQTQFYSVKLFVI